MRNFFSITNVAKNTFWVRGLVGLLGGVTLAHIGSRTVTKVKTGKLRIPAALFVLAVYGKPTSGARLRPFEMYPLGEGGH